MRPNRRDVPIPKLMRTLEKDHRGYPIPIIIQRDKAGKPLFTMNDARIMEDCRKKRLCSICGKKMTDGFWMVGGSRAFLHEDGVFRDSPVHLECAEYALQVCPFLVARSYTKEIGEAVLDPKQKPDGLKLFHSEFSGSRLPERFGLGLTEEYPTVGGVPVERTYLVSSWRYIEWWRQGDQVNAPDTYIVSST